MPFHMMDANERDVVREGERLTVADADQERPDEAGRVRDRYRVQPIEGCARLAQRSLDDRYDARQMRARRNLRDYSTEHSMHILRQDHQRFLTDVVATAFQNGCRRLVA